MILYWYSSFSTMKMRNIMTLWHWFMLIYNIPTCQYQTTSSILFGVPTEPTDLCPPSPGQRLFERRLSRAPTLVEDGWNHGITIPGFGRLMPGYIFALFTLTTQTFTGPGHNFTISQNAMSLFFFQYRDNKVTGIEIVVEKINLPIESLLLLQNPLTCIILN